MNSIELITKCVVPLRHGVLSFSSTGPAALSCTRSELHPLVGQRLLWVAAGVNRPDLGGRTALSAMSAQEVLLSVAMLHGAGAGCAAHRVWPRRCRRDGADGWVAARLRLRLTGGRTSRPMRR